MLDGNRVFPDELPSAASTHLFEHKQRSRCVGRGLADATSLHLILHTYDCVSCLLLTLLDTYGLLSKNYRHRGCCA
jgi:hypothetical protein